MTWWYELVDAGDGRLVEMKRGFPTEKDAQAAAEIARRMIVEIDPRRIVKIVTGEDIYRPE